MINCRAKAAELRIEGVKIVAAEFTFDGARLSFLYSTETEGKVDLRNLRNAMQRTYPRSRVEMQPDRPARRGPKLSRNGRLRTENRCAARCSLTELANLHQDWPRNRALADPFGDHRHVAGGFAAAWCTSTNSTSRLVRTSPNATNAWSHRRLRGKVVDVYPLKQAVLVELDSGTRQEFLKEDIPALDELEPCARRPQAPV